MSKQQQNYDLVIVGAGLVGATLAAAVASGEYGRRCRIAVVEAGGEPERHSGADFDPRVVALTLSSRDLLTQAGAWPAIELARVCPYRNMTVWDGEGTGRIHFSAAEVHSDQLGCIVENSVAVRAVRQCLAEQAGVTMIQPAKVVSLYTPEPGEPVLTLDNGTRLQAPLIIAADGARSRVRELAGFHTREWDYGQSAIVTTVRTECPHQYTAWQRFMHTGPLAFLPLQLTTEEGIDDRYCSIVWSADTPLAEDLMSINDQQFCARLGLAFEHTLGAIEQTAERFCVPLRQRHATGYAQPGIALVGDAAHNIHPLAGQGVNLGLLDVAVLARELERALAREIPLGDFSILRRYQRQRLAGNLGMMGAMEGFKRLFGNRSLALCWLRNTGMQQLDSLPLFKNAVARRAMGL
jgi:2-octaprenylphenol hydroxylase